MDKPKKIEELKTEALSLANDAATLEGTYATITYRKNVTRRQIAEAYGQVLEETRAKGVNDPHKLLESQYKLRVLNEQFEMECEQSEAFYLELLTKPEDD